MQDTYTCKGNSEAKGVENQAMDTLTLRRHIAIYRQSRSDVRITCHGVIFRVHSRIISAHSATFRRPSEITFDQNGELDIRLDEGALIAVKCMVDYLYSLQYRLPKNTSRYLRTQQRSAFSPALAHAQVYIIAEQCGLPHLGDLAITHLKGSLEVHTLAFIRTLGHFPALANLRAQEFISLTKYIYDNTPPYHGRLRSCLVDCMTISKFREVWCRRMIWDKKLVPWWKEEFDELLAAVPEFASDLLSAVSGKSELEPCSITHHDICMAFYCRGATLAELLSIGDPPPDVYLEDDAEDWKSESIDEEVLRMEEHPDYDVEAEVEETNDPPPDLYLADDAAECEMEEVAAEVMNMIHGR